MAKTIKVKLVNGKIVCEPGEQRATAGEQLEWVGEPHNGHFVGRVKEGFKQNGFSDTELDNLEKEGKLEKGLFPTNAESWANGTTLTVLPNKQGTYKYFISVGDQVLDPVVIIDDGLDS